MDFRPGDRVMLGADIRTYRYHPQLRAHELRDVTSRGWLTWCGRLYDDADKIVPARPIQVACALCERRKAEAREDE